MTTRQTLFTRHDYARLPEGFPAELIEGQLVKEPAPAPNHQVVQSDLQYLLTAALGRRRVLCAPADIVLDEHNVYQPDVIVYEAPLPATAEAYGLPMVAIEVLSPSTEARDREVKRAHLLRAGVREVWLVDLLEGTIEVHGRDFVETAHGDHCVPSRCLPALDLAVNQVVSPLI